MTDLDLHPAAEVVPEEVGGDGVEHVHLVRLEGDRLLVEVVPANKQYSTVQCSTVQYSISIGQSYEGRDMKLLAVEKVSSRAPRLLHRRMCLLSHFKNLSRH